VIVTVAACGPVANGENARLIVQPALTVYAPLQPFATVNSPALVPPRTTEEICNVALPELVRVTICGLLVVPCVTLPNETLLGVTVMPAFGGGAPMPLSGMDCGEFGASSVMVMVAAREPRAIGEKVTLIVQLVFTP
jgi:hypothetical protein